MDATFSYFLPATIIVLFLTFASRQCFSCRKKRRSGLEEPPSPPWRFPIIGHLHLLKKGKPLHRTLAHLCVTHGSPVLLRLGFRPVLVVSSLAVAEECLSTHDLAFANRPRFASGKYFNYNYTAVVAAEYGPHWRNLRRLTAIEVLSNHRLGEFYSVRLEEIRFLIASLARGDGEASPESSAVTLLRRPDFRKVTLRPLVFRLVFNNLMRMMVGTRYSGEAKEDAEIDMFRKIVEETFLLLGGATNITDFVPFLRWLGFTGVEKRIKALQKKRDGFLQGMVDQQRRKRSLKEQENEDRGIISGERRRLPVVDVMLSLQEEDPKYYTDDIIKGVIVSMISAGSDTSTLTIEWVMALLLNHPKALHALDTEIGSVVLSRRLVDESDLHRLPYLQAVIDETLRLFPVAPLLVPHESSEDCTIAGYHVPRGTMLLINAWEIHRNAEVWSDPLEFRPERFLHGESAARTMPFGSGRRRCPGEAMAMKVVGLTVAALVQCFDWKRVGEEKVDLQEGMGLTMPKAVPLEAMCRPREETLKAIAL